MTQPPWHAHIVTDLFHLDFESKEVGKRGGKRRREERERYRDALEKKKGKRGGGGGGGEEGEEKGKKKGETRSCLREKKGKIRGEEERGGKKKKEKKGEMAQIYRREKERKIKNILRGRNKILVFLFFYSCSKMSKMTLDYNLVAKIFSFNIIDITCFFVFRWLK